MNMRIPALIAALVLSSSGASAATIGLLPVTIDGVVQTFQRENGNLITLWSLDNTVSVGLGSGDVTITAANEITNRFLLGTVVSLYNGANPINSGAVEFDPLTFSFVVPDDAVLLSSLWVEWTGDNLLYLNPNQALNGVTSEFITSPGDPVPVIPVPAAMPLLLLGVGALGLTMRRRKAA
jgi:hypothetical protein